MNQDLPDPDPEHWEKHQKKYDTITQYAVHVIINHSTVICRNGLNVLPFTSDYEGSIIDRDQDHLQKENPDRHYISIRLAPYMSTIQYPYVPYRAELPICK